ncbi:hypothetical protein SY88_13225 [Clostridiales bacterium PH28_bin88]|nr:hypothetical protein SY88_13225 [Clostridiales bacterium PH28_bin88]
MNIHINKHTRFQSWEGKTFFNEYPVHIRSGNITVTLLFYDKESIDNLRQILAETMFEIEPEPNEFLEKYIATSVTSVKNKRI